MLRGDKMAIKSEAQITTVYEAAKELGFSDVEKILKWVLNK